MGTDYVGLGWLLRQIGPYMPLVIVLNHLFICLFMEK
jgi:hypothetical protein